MEDAKAFRWHRVPARGVRDATRNRSGARAILVGHLIFLLGGKQYQPYLGDILDINQKKWSKIPEAAWKLILDYPAATLYDDKFVLLGVTREKTNSERSHRTLLRDAFTLDVTSLEAERLPTYGTSPGQVFNNSADLYEEGNQLVLYGVCDDVKLKRKENLMFLNLETMVWRIPKCKGKEPTRLILHSSYVIRNTLFLVGSCFGVTFVDSAVIYLIRLNKGIIYTWEQLKPRGYPAAPMNVINRPALACIGPGKILMFGGISKGPTNNLYVLEDVLTSEPKWHEVSQAHVQNKSEPSKEYSCFGYGPMRCYAPCGVSLVDKVIIIPGTSGRHDDGNEYYELRPDTPTRRRKRYF